MYIHHIYIIIDHGLPLYIIQVAPNTPYTRGGQQGWSSPVCIVHQSKWAFSSDLTSSNWVN